VLDFDESGKRFCSYTLGRRVRGDELGVIGLQEYKFTKKPVVLSVGYFGLIKRVVEVVVTSDFAAKSINTYAGILLHCEENIAQPRDGQVWWADEDFAMIAPRMNVPVIRKILFTVTFPERDFHRDHVSRVKLSLLAKNQLSDLDVIETIDHLFTCQRCFETYRHVRKACLPTVRA
jgi:hypothetical protein